MAMEDSCGGHALGIAIVIAALVLLLAGEAGAANAIWDEESGSPLPFTWNYTNFDGFNVSGIGTENLTIVQTNLGAAVGKTRKIRNWEDPLGAGLIYSTTRVLKEYEISTFPKEISGCTVINTPGAYVLTQNIINSSASTCINITSSMTLTNVTVKNLKVTDWTEGIEYVNTADSIIANNTANSAERGIQVAFSSRNTLTSNIASANHWEGIYITYSSNNTVINNSVNSNYAGIYLWNSSSDKIYHNNILNNTNQAHDNTGTNSWDSGYPGGGNYWSDFNGTDANNDGIGDTRYNISGGAGAQDRYPFMKQSGWVSTIEKGDVSGDGQINVVDALFVAQYTVGLRTLSSSRLAIADVNCDGNINVVDALFIAQYTVGLKSTFCFSEPPKTEGFLLIEDWYSEEGNLISGNASEIPFLCIDFPMYYINELNKTLIDYAGLLNNSNLSKTKIIFASGTSLGGVLGSGVASGLTTYEEFPVHINRSAYHTGFNYTIDIISDEKVLINNSIEILPGRQYLYHSNKTQNYGNALVFIQERIVIKNYGIWPKDSYVSQKIFFYP